MVEISIMENQVLFKTETMYFYSRLLEGNYPDTNRLIPTSHNTQIEFYVPELLSAIERASLLSHEGRNNIVRLSISPDSVVLYGNSPEIGKVEEALNYENVSGEALDISFNPDYMKDALRAFGDMNITVPFSNSSVYIGANRNRTRFHSTNYTGSYKLIMFKKTFGKSL